MIIVVVVGTAKLKGIMGRKLGISSFTAFKDTGTLYQLMTYTSLCQLLLTINSAITLVSILYRYCTICIPVLAMVYCTILLNLSFPLKYVIKSIE